MLDANCFYKTDKNKLKQYGHYFVELTTAMKEKLSGQINECDGLLKQGERFVYLDSVYMSSYDVFKLCKEFRLSLLTGKIAVDLLPVRLVAGSTEYRTLQKLINEKEREKWLEGKEV